MSAIAVRVLRKRYFDSVQLMAAANRLAREPGVEDAAAMMGTIANKDVLRGAGYADGTIDAAAADDLVVAIRAATPADAEAALTRLDTLLADEQPEPSARAPRSIDGAIELRPDLNVALISVPGEYAAAEIRRSLDRGLHVFCFSSGVAVEDEVELKALATSKGLLLMGPDCGTSIIGGVGLGFANAVRRGPIGIVGASGTGIQAVSTQLHRAGSGVSHAIGTGGRDLSAAVGGVTTIAALDALARDPGTEAIVLLGKSPSAEAIDRVRQVDTQGKPLIGCFFDAQGAGARTLDDAAERALHAIGIHPATEADAWFRQTKPQFATTQCFIRGLFAGGTFCAEAQRIALDAGLEISTNAPLEGAHRIDSSKPVAGHAFIDIGAEEFTQGRPHPMIDARARVARLRTEAAQPDVAVIVLDVVLGYGAAPDPAGDIARAIEAARADARDAGRALAVIASVCGTDEDPQGRATQEKVLHEAGAFVAPTNAAATRLAIESIRGAS